MIRRGMLVRSQTTIATRRPASSRTTALTWSGSWASAATLVATLGPCGDNIGVPAAGVISTAARPTLNSSATAPAPASIEASVTIQIVRIGTELRFAGGQEKGAR